MNLQELETILGQVAANVYRYTAPIGTADPYIVWAEDGQARSVWADDKMQCQVITGTVDLFSKSPNDSLINDIQLAFNANDISWRLNSVQYEDATKFIHHEWVWQIWQN